MATIGIQQAMLHLTPRHPVEGAVGCGSPASETADQSTKAKAKNPAKNRNAEPAIKIEMMN